MLDQLFHIIDLLEDNLWLYLGTPAIIVLGLYFSLRGGFFQVFRFPAIIRLFTGLIGKQEEGARGVHPLKTFFAAVGGCIGIGNIVAVCTAVQLGGPGALLWLWVAGAVGMMIKYAEVYLGIRYRVYNANGSFDGGPMYFLQPAFKNRWIPAFVCLMLCVYGVEVYMYRVITDSISLNLNINSYIVAGVLLPLILLGGTGGVQRVGNISSAIIPTFLLIFCGMSLWVLMQNLSAIPGMMAMVFKSAFTGHAAVGAFTGSTMMMAMSQGVRRACYTGDIAVGYASVIHSETSTPEPQRQAALAIFGIFLDTFVICTLSILLILVTGVWSEPLPATLLIQTALDQYFPFVPVFMSILIFLLGYSTMIAFLVVGLKCAEYLFPKYGRKLYTAYAAVSLVLFTFVDTDEALVVMSLAGVVLVLVNLVGMVLLRNEVKYPESGKPL